jgi:hypothetical protein
MVDGVGMPPHTLIAQVDSGNPLGPDLLVSVNGGVALWRRTDTFAFTDVSTQSQLPQLAGKQISVGDVDNNGYQDMVVWGQNGLTVYLNDGNVFVASGSSSSTVFNPTIPDDINSVFSGAWNLTGSFCTRRHEW